MTKSREENEQLDKQEQHPCRGAQNPAPVSPVRDFFADAPGPGGEKCAACVQLAGYAIIHLTLKPKGVCTYDKLCMESAACIPAADRSGDPDGLLVPQ